MKNYALIFLMLMSCTLISQNDTKTKKSIYKTIDAWHEAAANADFDSYFKLMTEDAVFIGTDATENWHLEEFKEFSKPYFDKGKAWSFTSLERNIYLDSNKNLAWFDEILDTQMGLCRGSGVVVLTENGWKIKHYVLSITIPNPKVKNVVNIKKDTDSLLKQKLKLKTE